MVVRVPRDIRPTVVQFGRAAIGETRPNPLLGRKHIMENDEIQKADQTGVYTLADGTHVRLKKGDPIPLGATFRDAGLGRPMSARSKEKAAIVAAGQAAQPDADPSAVETVRHAVLGDDDDGKRAKTAAPENRAKHAAPEARGDGGMA